MKTKILLILLGYFTITSCSLNSEKNKNSSKVKVFVSWPGAEARPHYYWPEGTNKPKGIEPEVLELILKKAGLDYQYVSNFRFSGSGDPRIEAITSGAADITMRGISVTPEREQLVNFSIPYYMDGLSALVRDGSSISNLEDLKNKRVFAYSYTTAHQWGKENLSESDLITFDIEGNSEFIEPEQLLLQDSIDAYILDYSFLKHEEKTHKGLRVLDKKFTSEPLAIAVDKDNPMLLDKINKAIQELQNTKEFQTIIKGFEN